ncbi:hypothetical protein G3O06_28325 [Burkholderia sp. Ac-20345]|uniref:hypothetical protein n=1 Tax=Burkholderia sp. Ac-20345 TaxID=2703891 RepID=UPI00197CACD6|nr:hypothetical protein [Burkholderia sp. Ac-20345]MBN3781421.1 hypothetical protein [Burkholderia sp. Ac-20345]
MIVGGAEHEIDFVTIRFPIRLLASFDRIHPALRQMASRRSRLDLKKHAEQADHDALRRLPGPFCYVDLFRERTFRFGAPSNSIFFNDIQLLEIHHVRTISNVRQVTLTQITAPDPDTVYSSHLNNLAQINSLLNLHAPQIRKLSIDQINTGPGGTVITRCPARLRGRPGLPCAENRPPHVIRSSQHSIFPFQTNY